jgi:hypothetical protein
MANPMMARMVSPVEKCANLLTVDGMLMLQVMAISVTMNTERTNVPPTLT